VTVQPWVAGPYAAFDLETTGPDPFEARIVTATIVEVGGGGVLAERHWLVDPGVEIPAEAAAIHGVTTERARAEGARADVAAYEITCAVAGVFAAGYPLVIFNANYDLTVLTSELWRHNEALLDIGFVLDPLVIDRALDRWRSGKRRLADVCQAYGVRQDGEHSSGGDALAAARLTWRMARDYSAVGHRTLQELQAWQADQHAAWAEDFEAFLRRKGRPDVIEREWPVRPRPVAVGSSPGPAGAGEAT
jgi:DNA polymerase III subunit epsilon